MSAPQAKGWTRRRFLGGLTLAGTAGVLGLHPRPIAAEPPPETTALRLARTASICQAPQYVAEALLEAEGFIDVQVVGETAAADRTLVSGDAQMGMLFLGPFLDLQEGSCDGTYSGFQISVWRSRNRKRSPWLCPALTPPSPGGGMGITGR